MIFKRRVSERNQVRISSERCNVYINEIKRKAYYSIHSHIQSVYLLNLPTCTCPPDHIRTKSLIMQPFIHSHIDSATHQNVAISFADGGVGDIIPFVLPDSSI